MMQALAGALIWICVFLYVGIGALGMLMAFLGQALVLALVALVGLAGIKLFLPKGKSEDDDRPPGE